MRFEAKCLGPFGRWTLCFWYCKSLVFFSTRFLKKANIKRFEFSILDLIATLEQCSEDPGWLLHVED